MQSGCDTLSDFFQNHSKQQQSTEESDSTMPSYEKTLLLNILENQKVLLGEMQYARTNGDKRLIKESYEEILRLDKNYQEEFKKYEVDLSQTDGLEISQKHYEIIKSIPSYSSLME
jgi:hypothetical protein